MKLFLRQRIALIVCLFYTWNSHAAVTVEVAGVPEPLLTNVRAYLSLAKAVKRSKEGATQLSDFAISRLHSQGEDEIRQALMPFGYYSPTITESLEQQGPNRVARYEIDKGQPTLLGEVDIQLGQVVSQRPAVSGLLAKTKVKTGQILNHDSYTQLKQNLLRMTIAAGHLDAAYKRAEIMVSPEIQSASIKLHLEPGPAYTFGTIELQQDAVDQSFANRFITIKTGEPFSTERLIALQFVLNDSGYFKSVSVDAARKAAVDQKIPVVIVAQSRESQRYSARVGIGTDTGPRVRLGTEFRRLSGRGNKFQSDIQVSAIKSSATAQYSMPIKNVATDKQAFYGSFDRAEIGDTDSDLYSLGARRYDRWKDLRRQLYVEFENEIFSIAGQNDVRSELLVFGGSLAYQKADDALFTRRGISARIEVHGSHTALLADTTFAQATLSARGVYPLGKKGRLLLRTDIGMTEVDDLSDLPPSQRFFTGGDHTVRGYEFEQLSPSNDEGASIGGRYLISGSVEGDYFFTQKYGIAAFFDHGNAVNSLDDPLESSFGLGFRYRTPVGVLRIDVARPMDTAEDDYRLHLSLGPDL